MSRDTLIPKIDIQTDAWTHVANTLANSKLEAREIVIKNNSASFVDSRKSSISESYLRQAIGKRTGLL